MDSGSTDDARPSRLFSVSGLAEARLPVLVAVPHAGRDYPDEILLNARVPQAVLERLEDRHVDMLAVGAAASGCATLVAHVARAWIDLNRAPSEIDPQMIVDAPRTAFAQPSAKVRGGLGLVPRRLADHGELWRKPWTRNSIATRVSSLHDPYHQALSEALASLRARFGCALLIDLHSMPPLRPEGPGPVARIVVGDRYGRSAGASLCDLAVRALGQGGFEVALNHPYAGGYVLERHGRPARNIHALQIEVDRSLYLDASLSGQGEGLNDVQEAVAMLARTLANDLLRDVGGQDIAIAAE
ncbi:N-formylglutamate amidohydrolase [Blastomonas sp.]|uniref:N-formylglutamate amidohydrolase n=1 Tax=Blastomonas sp. TaxID=1909299 RepID=UPI002614F0DC|nr:N-formylglutamate amidohydrolase [Blastomonas sp.]MDM7954827.1 N-formylglutamate amidohydrolase [Blastomonas sp.]